MDEPKPANPRRSIKVWHLALAVLAIGLILRLSLGAFPLAPSPQVTADTDSLGTTQQATQVAQGPLAPVDLSIVQVLPIGLNGEVPGPLLTAVLQRYLPDSTSDHADALRDTLPPGQDPRMIVIIPEADEAVF